MAILTGSFLVDILMALVFFLFLAYWYITNNNDYWDKRGVPNVKKGLMTETLLGRQSQVDTTLELYRHFTGEKFAGFFQLKQPALMIRDVELINKVLVKDFTYFQDRGNPEFKNDPLSMSLFNLKGHVWRALRYKLTATFTTGKLKGMFDQISKCGNNMIQSLKENVTENNEIESKPVLFEYTQGVILSCAFGVQFERGSEEFNIFTDIVQKIANSSIGVGIRFSLGMLFPKLVELLDLKIFSNDVTNYFLNLTKANLKYRKDNNVHRNDYFQLLMTLREQEDSGKEIVTAPTDTTEDDEVIDQMKYTEQSNQPLAANMKLMTDEVICSNSFIFLTAGSESTASTINFALFKLAQHLDIQQRLQQEIDSVLRQHGSWSYDALKDMTYLDQVVQESQRILPLIPMLLRECVRPYKIPDSNLVIEEGVLVAIPAAGLQMDPQYYPEPERFNPDRFEGNNFKPNPTFLPFGDGPRICIAMRFAVMEVKLCIAKIISEYSVKVSPKTQMPIKFKKRSFITQVEGGIWLLFEERKTNGVTVKSIFK